MDKAESGLLLSFADNSSTTSEALAQYAKLNHQMPQEVDKTNVAFFVGENTFPVAV